MSKNRRDPKKDANQPDIVIALRALEGVTVLEDVDDILVGYRNRNYLIEIKNPEYTLDKDGRATKDCFEESQIDLFRDWQGQYSPAWTYEDCLEIIGWNK